MKLIRWGIIKQSRLMEITHAPRCGRCTPIRRCFCPLVYNSDDCREEYAEARLKDAGISPIRT